MDYMLVDPAGSVSIAIGASSASATIPANAERVGIVASGNAHWRMGKGAQTAIAADPMITNANGVLVVKVPVTGSGIADTIAVIQDGTSTGNVSVFRVAEE
jgi:hypothetical protein